jgi:hypothetical protein
MTFKEKNELLRTECVEYIKSVLRKRGEYDYELIDPATYEDVNNYDDSVFDMPSATNKMKGDGTYDDYALVSVSLKKGILEFYGVGLTHTDEEEFFVHTDLSTEALCKVCDIIKDLEYE